jgi:hypothetical protein
MLPDLHDWLEGFNLDPGVHEHARHVLAALPPAVCIDLIEDPGFILCHPQPGAGVVMRAPTTGRSSRSVVLKRHLSGRPEPFVRWVIAHELAHAYLRNAGRWPGDDPEHATDALAAEWGFPRPVSDR